MGMQGKAALHDLMQQKERNHVIVADYEIDLLNEYIRENQLENRVQCIYVDAKENHSLNQLLQCNPEIIIDLLPSEYVDDIAEFAVKNNIHLVNANYATDKMRELSKEAEKNEITILPEFGLDPGIDLVLLGEVKKHFDKIMSIKSYGAGLPEPQAANNPINYKITWTFEGVLNSYFTGARVIRDGSIINIEQGKIFNPEHIHEIEIPQLGKLEAFPNGDAVKFLDQLGINKDDIKEASWCTLRYPGHCDFWKKIIDLHLLDDEPVQIDEVIVDRKKYLAKAMEAHIRLGMDEKDIALVRIEVAGKKDGKTIETIYQVLDKRDLNTGFTAMNRTTGFTASIGAQMIEKGIIRKRGLLSPIYDIPYDIFSNELQKRDIVIHHMDLK
jgi:saccharopine dehydrogenase-like NADP-dependent oxidoreductase